MFNKHVENSLTAYLHGELDTAAAERIRIHLGSCGRCRVTLDALKVAARALESLPRQSAPDSVWSRIEAQIVALPAVEPTRERRWSKSLQLAGAAGIAVIGVIVAVSVMRRSPVTPPETPGSATPSVSWKVAALKGAPKIEQRTIRGNGRLGAGEWLETDSKSAARVQIADIGNAVVKANSRLSLVSSAANEHRMHLERGEIHARVAAPPRLFMVQTPSALAVDLGCEYTLTARPDGSSLLKVISGWVAMEIAGKASQVSTDMICVTKHNLPPGTPYHEKANLELVKALLEFDFNNGGSRSIDTILSKAVKNDSLTLWHLLQRVDSVDQPRVYATLDKLVPAPKDVTLEKVAAGSQSSLDAWKDAVEYAIYPPIGFNVTNFALEVLREQKKGAKK